MKTPKTPKTPKTLCTDRLTLLRDAREASLALRFVILFLVIAAIPARASIGLVVGEPFGSFGTMFPSGHAGIYLDHLCAASPTELRRCLPGELGVVISRYHDLTGQHLDWMAVPASVFFYGVDDPADAPRSMTASLEAEIRERYRQQHLLAAVPDRIDRHGRAHRPDGDWAEAIGAAFDRRLFLYLIDTTPTEDARLLAALNTLPNQRRYSLRHANCADFAADILALALPAHPTRNFFADFDMTSPKNLARQIDDLQGTHPELHLRVYQVAQIPGTLRRSRPMRGAAETFLKTKRYLATVLVLQPELIVADWIVYEARGRWKPGLDAVPISPSDLTRLSAMDLASEEGVRSGPVFPAPAPVLYSPASIASSSSASPGIGLRAK